MTPLTAIATSTFVAVLAWRARSLTASGAVAAILVGTAVLLGTGWAGGAVLLTFFISSSALSRLQPVSPLALDTKGGQRDHWQVLSNGGAAALGALAGLVAPGLGLWIVTTTFAAAAADTWATSFGESSPIAPRNILSRKVVPRGTSGGITVRGTLGGGLGAIVVALVGALASRSALLFGAGAAIGFLAMLLDSVLGAAWQGKFYCQGCDQATERRIHRCGATTALRSGWRWLDNDGVNALATSVAAVAGWGAWVVVGGRW